MPSLIDIPIAFEYEGIFFSGTFTSRTGNEHAWDLNLHGYQYGTLVKYSTGWQWCPNLRYMFMEDYMEQFFIKTVEDYLNNQAAET